MVICKQADKKEANEHWIWLGSLTRGGGNKYVHMMTNIFVNIQQDEIL